MRTARIYEADAVSDIKRLSDQPCTLLPDIFMWTTNEGPGEEPSHLIINTMATQHVFVRPRLVEVNGRSTILSALSDHGASGTMDRVKKFYISIEGT